MHVQFFKVGRHKLLKRAYLKHFQSTMTRRQMVAVVGHSTKAPCLVVNMKDSGHNHACHC